MVCTGATIKPVRAPTFRVEPSSLDSHKVGRYVNLFNWGNTEACFYFNSCTCNEFDGLVRRHLLSSLDDYDPKNPLGGTISALEHMLSVAVEFSKGLDISKVDHATLMSHTRPKLKTRYQKAYDSLRSRRYADTEVPSNITAFVKIEKMAASKITKAPRLIQYRNFKFTYLMKSWQVLMSKRLKESKSLIFGQRKCTAFTKNFDNPGVASILKESWDSFSRPVALCLDHSTWDAHVTPEFLEIEHEFWRRCMRRYEDRRQFDILVRSQLNNKGRTKHGLRYRVRGSRMSGEYSTSDGNCILNWCLLVTWLQRSGVKRFRVHVNGDDSVIFIDAHDLSKLQLPEEGGMIRWFRRLNMETKLDRVAHDFSQIEFCQSSPIRVDERWRLVRKPERCISRSFICEGRWWGKRLRDYIGTYGLGELAQHRGVPVLQAWSVYLLSYMTKRPVNGVDFTPARLSGNNSADLLPISLQSRIDFQSAFGWTINQQLQIEKMLAGVTNQNCPNVTDIIKRYSQYHLQH